MKLTHSDIGLSAILSFIKIHQRTQEVPPSKVVLKTHKSGLTKFNMSAMLGFIKMVRYFKSCYAWTDGHNENRCFSNIFLKNIYKG
jgi:hypothetical protein